VSTGAAMEQLRLMLGADRVDVDGCGDMLIEKGGMRATICAGVSRSGDEAWVYVNGVEPIPPEAPT
jgi:hypothetical protein